MKREVIIATGNLGKFSEIQDLLAAEFDTFYSLNDFDEKLPIVEDSPLYIENAMKKARKVGDRFGLPSIADDSGLEVRALQGRPGVLSARYARTDAERIERLLHELKGVSWERRKAVFKAYVVFYLPEKERAHLFFGQLEGFIGFDMKGAGGFGFDPVFFVPESNRYLAELTMEEKNRLSHRGRAIAALKAFLKTDSFRNPVILG